VATRISPVRLRDADSLSRLAGLAFFVTEENVEGDCYRRADECDQDGFCMACDRRDDPAAVNGAEVGKNRKADGASDRESDQEFVARVLHRASGNQERNHRGGRRQDCRYHNSTETPLLERLRYLVHLSA